MRKALADAMRLLAVVLSSFPVGPVDAKEVPKGWIKAGQHPNDYEMALDPKGGGAETIKLVLEPAAPRAKTEEASHPD